MINYKRGDVVLAEVVFSEGTGTKKRPALIISSDEYHHGRQEVIIAAVTSNVKRMLYLLSHELTQIDTNTHE
ncbi:MAG: type II toxin-antitoxin system PemK/MazF family toxin [bacterium]|nr:type II toxin-antitoxin system PemK/MazF family toxin [bacterium]